MHYRLIALCAILLAAVSGISLKAATANIVLYATDVSRYTGWSLEMDATAAGGWKLSSPDDGWSSTEQPPPAASAPTASFIFSAPAAGNYRIWLRLKGKANSKFNESVWVQFSNATRYSWGSNEGLLVNLENCSACGIQGWGWQDNSWWLNQTSVVTLPAGEQYLYVTVREDGVELDQIVLSPQQFFNNAPGPVKNDTTILPKSTDERITLTGIDLRIKDSQVEFNLTGTNQFSVTATASTFEGASGALVSCTVVAGCPANTEVPFRGDWRGLDLFSAPVSYRGASYPVNGLEDDSTIGLLVAGFVKTPSGNGRTDGEIARVQTSFHAGGVFDYAGQPGEPTGRALLVGGGLVVFDFKWSAVDQAWYTNEAYFLYVNPGVAAVNTKEIVLHASDVVTLSGLTLVDDASAAGGKKISSADTGREWLNAPPAPTEAPYAAFSFNVPANGTYRVWLRMRGQASSKWNESVWVQFSHARRNNAPVYQWGSSSGLLVNLENCSACGIQGWGWQDNSWWLNQSPLVDLSAGMHNLYVTLREDGVEFDQIVLSRERFLSQAPGPVKNDNTIVAKVVVADQVHLAGPNSAVGFDGDNGWLELVGVDGFFLDARFHRLDGAPDTNGVFSCGTLGCEPGALVTINGYWMGDDLTGKLDYRMKGYEFAEELNFGEVQFRGFIKMPAAGAATATIAAPYTFYGTIWYSDDGVNQKTVRYLGGGLATFNLRFESDGLWYVDSYHFDVSRPSQPN